VKSVQRERNVKILRSEEFTKNLTFSVHQNGRRVSVGHHDGQQHHRSQRSGHALLFQTGLVFRMEMPLKVLL
jgi:hypothetical protein